MAEPFLKRTTSFDRVPISSDGGIDVKAFLEAVEGLVSMFGWFLVFSSPPPVFLHFFV
jgi:hypothetical protein